MSALKFLLAQEPDGSITFSGSISPDVLSRLRLFPVEQKLLDDLRPGEPAHEYLLALEMIFRRANEQGLS